MNDNDINLSRKQDSDGSQTRNNASGYGDSLPETGFSRDASSVGRPAAHSSAAPSRPAEGRNPAVPQARPAGGAHQPSGAPHMRAGRGAPGTAKPPMSGTLTFERITAQSAVETAGQTASTGMKPSDPAASDRIGAQSPSLQHGAPATQANPNQRPTRNQTPPSVRQQPMYEAQNRDSAQQSSQMRRQTENPNQSSSDRTGKGSSASRNKVKRQKESKPASQVVRFGDDREKQRGGGHSGIRSLIKALVYIAVVLIISVVLGIFGINVSNDVFAFVKDDDEITVEIPEYMTTAELADILYESGVIKYPLIFKIYNGRNDNGVEFVAGTYTVSTNTSYDELFAKFQKSTVREVIRVTIPEGYTTMEIIKLLVENGVGTEEGFTEVVNNYDFSSFGYKFLEGLTVSEDRTYRLEGYLYPDTYDFYKARGITADDDMYIYTDEVMAITKFLDRFDRVFTEELYGRIDELGMTMDQVVILASLIEKEGKYVSEFEDISSVFHNRLKNSAVYPRLQSDATISYAIMSDTGSRPEKVEDTDKYYDNPYNTYMHDGLPPGPIANPGYNAITCALYPSATTYFYFVATKSGTNLFASTLDEHTRNINISRGLIPADSEE